MKKKGIYRGIQLIFRKAFVLIRKKYVSQKVKNSNISIIANNCVGADICHSLGMRFNSPTVNLQILPQDYIKFCSDLTHYLNEDIRECTVFTPNQRQMIKKEYGREAEELRFPFGVCDDILIAFQYYKSFEKAKEDWNRRRTRLNYSRCGIIMLFDRKYEKEVQLFDKINCNRKMLLTVNWSTQLPNTKTAAIDNLPAGVHFMEYRDTYRKYYEINFDIAKWVLSLTEE